MCVPLLIHTWDLILWRNVAVGHVVFGKQTTQTGMNSPKQTGKREPDEREGFRNYGSKIRPVRQFAFGKPRTALLMGISLPIPAIWFVALTA